jgi:hypothetical protein
LRLSGIVYARTDTVMVEVAFEQFPAMIAAALRQIVAEKLL